MKMITVLVEIHQPVSKVWEYINNPAHIEKWNFAHPSWECVNATNDLQVGGILKSRMQARDDSLGFDFVAVYDEIIPEQLMKYHLDDGRHVIVTFEEIDENLTKVVESFEPENENPEELQQHGWQSILDNFKKYCEAH